MLLLLLLFVLVGELIDVDVRGSIRCDRILCVMSTSYRGLIVCVVDDTMGMGNIWLT